MLLGRGKPYPLTIPPEGASAEFLRTDGNTLKIMLPSMDKKEERALREGLAETGLLCANNAILWLFRFWAGDRPLLTLDAPFDVRKIPRDILNLHSITNPNQRLLIVLHAIDDKGILRGIRAITLPADLTLEFLSAAQNQLADPRSDQYQHAVWMQQQPDQLTNSTKMWTMGK